MEKPDQFKTLKIKDAAYFIGIGLILILVSVLVDTVHLITTNNKVLIFLNEFFVQILSHIGIACLALGIITILLDMGHWSHYFEERLRNIVVEKKYLEKLETRDLINLQTEVLKAYFKNDEIGGNDGFLRYYQKNIQSIIGTPFREDVNSNFHVTYEDNELGTLRIVETLSYTCRANAGKIQNNICFLPEKEELLKVLDFNLTLQHDNLKKEGESGIINLNKDALKIKNAIDNINDGFNFDIRELNFNGLNVVIKASYLVNINRFFAWRMSHPTRFITFNISFPKDLIFIKEFFFNMNDSRIESLDAENGYYYLKVHDWLLPDEGLTFQLLRPISLTSPV